MRNESQTVKLDKDSLSMSIEDMYKRFKEAIELVNNVYSSLLRIPAGFYRCFACKTQLVEVYKEIMNILGWI